MNKINKKSKGAISNIILILGVMLLVLVVVIFVIIKTMTPRNTNDPGPKNPSDVVVEIPKPVYETNIGDVKFIFESAQNIGNVLKSKDLRFQPDLTTTEKFIKVTIGAQDKGKVNIPKGTWDIGNIIDSDGRNFIPVDQNNQFSYFLSGSNLCGKLLKPEFEPTPCVKYYEVSKQSTKLKIEVNTTKEEGSSKKQESFLDLIVQ